MENRANRYGTSGAGLPAVEGLPLVNGFDKLVIREAIFVHTESGSEPAMEALTLILAQTLHGIPRAFVRALVVLRAFFTLPLFTGQFRRSLTQADTRGITRTIIIS